jgi:NitT/TauT family transport system substrate-binding protein
VSLTRPSDSIRFADYNLNMPSFGLFATEDKIASRGAAIGKFASVVGAAWTYVLAGHEDEAVDAIVAQRPQAKLDKKVLRAQIEALRPFFQSPAAAGQPTGVPVAADWKIAVKTLSDAGLIKSIKDGNDFFAPGMVKPVVLKSTAAQ